MSLLIKRPEMLLTVVLVYLLPYLLLVRALRSRRVGQKHQVFRLPELSRMTLDDAYKIQLYLFELEFPFIAQKALEFALFRTYGIPSISSLLMGTRQFSTKACASKRMADTVVLVLEIIKQPPGSTRSISAIARMNYLHSIYQKAGKISNEDLLYTLGLFILEPIRWINRHEWRNLTDVETAAIGLFWKKVGDAMRISFEILPSAKTGWNDGLHFMHEVEKWANEYEKHHMVPAQSNKNTADHTTALLLYSVPSRFKATGLDIVTALMDERLRRAMLYPDPPILTQKAVDGALWSRKLTLRYLFLPRPYIFRKIIVSEMPNKSGRMARLIWDAEPWYVEATFMNRWSIQSWIDWLASRPIPGDGGDKYKPQGFHAHEIGPSNFSNKGLAEAERDEEWIREAFRGDSTV